MVFQNICRQIGTNQISAIDAFIVSQNTQQKTRSKCCTSNSQQMSYAITTINTKHPWQNRRPYRIRTSAHRPLSKPGPGTTYPPTIHNTHKSRTHRSALAGSRATIAGTRRVIVRTMSSSSPAAAAASPKWSCWHGETIMLRAHSACNAIMKTCAQQSAHAERSIRWHGPAAEQHNRSTAALNGAVHECKCSAGLGLTRTHTFTGRSRLGMRVVCLLVHMHTWSGRWSPFFVFNCYCWCISMGFVEIDAVFFAMNLKWDNLYIHAFLRLCKMKNYIHYKYIRYIKYKHCG